MYDRLKELLVRMPLLPEFPTYLSLGMNQNEGMVSLSFIVVSESPDGDPVLNAMSLGFDNIKVGRA
jgi:hypothetical protein